MKTKYKIVVYITGIYLLCSNLYAQYNPEWVARYNGPGNGNDYANCIALDKNGNIYVSGENVGIGTGNDIVTIKYNSSGNAIWTQTYNSGVNSRDAAYSIAVTNNNIYITGTINNNACIILKYNASGSLRWTRTYNNALGLKVSTDINENVYVAGYSDNNGTNADFLVLKYDSSGVLLWDRKYNGPGNDLDIAVGVGVDNSGNVFAGGDSYSGNNYLTSDYAVVKFNSSGVLQWVRRYNGPGNSLDEVYAFATDAVGNSYITGNCRNINNSDYTTIKYNASGDQQWVLFYNGPDNYYDGARAICLDANNNVIVTGFSSVTVNNDNFDYATVKYSPAGIQQWVKRYNGTGNNSDYASVVACDISNNVYVSGISWSGTKYEFATIKYNPAGNLVWVQRLGGTYNSGSEYVNGIVVDSLKCLYLAGCLSYSGTGMDYTTAKYGQLVKVSNNSSEIPSSFSLSQNYPNPFNPETKIQFSIPKTENRKQEIPSSEGYGFSRGVGMVTLKIYDPLGREVETLVNESLQPGTYEVTFNGSRYNSGVYFYRLQAGEFTETKRMLLVK